MLTHAARGIKERYRVAAVRSNIRSTKRFRRLKRGAFYQLNGSDVVAGLITADSRAIGARPLRADARRRRLEQLGSDPARGQACYQADR